MEQYNFFKGIHPDIDREILKIQSLKKTKKPKSTKKKYKTVWDPSFFDTPDQETSSFSQQQSKSYAFGPSNDSLNITHLNKEQLFEIMKNVMLQFLQTKKLSINRLENLIESIDSKKITKKAMKEKIIFFAKLLTIPMTYQKKKTRFDHQSRIVTEPHFNLKENMILKNVYHTSNEIIFHIQNTPDLPEEKYFLYCILAAVKFYYSNVIPDKYKCLTFLNIFQLLQPRNYSDILTFVQESFPSIFFIIQENGFENLHQKKRFSRYIFMNDKQITESITKTLGNHYIPKIFLKKNVSTKPYTVSFLLLTSAKGQIRIPIADKEEFCAN
jgi:hypothetical protein